MSANNGSRIPGNRALGGERTSLAKLAALSKKPAVVKEKKVTAIPKGKILLKKMFVLDTNGPISDPTCIFRFEEHDLYLTSTVLRELDNNKKGVLEVNRSVREFIRNLKLVVFAKGVKSTEGMPLAIPSRGIASGRLYFQDFKNATVPDIEDATNADEEILAVTSHLVKKYSKTHRIVLVSNDQAMQIKARLRGITAEPYQNNIIIKDIDLLYRGVSLLPKNFLDSLLSVDPWREEGETYYKISSPFTRKLLINEFVYSEDGKFNAQVIEKEGNVATFRIAHDYTNPKNAVRGIVARSLEQSFALNLLLDPNIHFVSLKGEAGCGKTLLALAAAIQQTVFDGLYNQIIYTRVTVPVGEDIGFFPGGEAEKMGNWSGAIEDAFEVLEAEMDKERKPVQIKSQKSKKLHEVRDAPDSELEKEKLRIRNFVKVKATSLMRGRSFFRKFIIIDEAQNLKDEIIKTLITRAGEGTKVICLGNLAQIDTPYLTEGSSGLTYVVEGFKDWEYSGTVTLPRGERSILANKANEVFSK